jgi:hypothetical protein
MCFGAFAFVSRHSSVSDINVMQAVFDAVNLIALSAAVF